MTAGRWRILRAAERHPEPLHPRNRPRSRLRGSFVASRIHSGSSYSRDQSEQLLRYPL